MLQAVPSLPQGITAHINNLNEREVAAAVRQQALSSARQTCRCTCWFPGLRCQTQWNPDWAKLAPIQRKTWLTAPDTSADVTGILLGVPALCCDDGKSRWLMVRRERKKGGGGREGGIVQWTPGNKKPVLHGSCGCSISIQWPYLLQESLFASCVSV